MVPFPKIITPYQRSAEEILKELRTTDRGLSQSEAQQRLETLGPNRFEEKGKRGALTILLSQAQDWMVRILVVAAAISYFLGDQIQSFVILGIVALSMVFGFIQDYRAEKALENLKGFISHKAHVLRDGHGQEIDAARLVIGDVVKLRIGDRIPADLRLLNTDGLIVDESILTGESLPVSKSVERSGRSNLPPQEQKNMTFAGTYVYAGEGVGVVTATGADTYFGQTAKILEQAAPPTEFQKQIKNFSRLLLRVTIIMTVFVFLVNAVLGKGYLESFLFAVALAVGITPELLPMIVTVTLSQGALKMARNKVVVKKLISIEDLGNIDTLCTDKTGTLTTGKLTFIAPLDTDFRRNDRILLHALACSSHFTHPDGVPASELDRALWESEAGTDLQKQLVNFKLLDENEFDFQRRRSSVLIQERDTKTLIVEGAPESVLSQCVFEDNVTKERAASKISDYEKNGNRVIAVASKTLRQEHTQIGDEAALTLEGILLFSDPVKETAKDSLELFRKLGVAIKIISGDSPRIVQKVAQEVGLAKADAKVITGEDLDKLDERKLAELAQKHTLFARTTPEQKEKIIASLNREGHIVSFLGDGVNDAPAISNADVGIAVDTGSEVAKGAADIVLLEKDLKVLAQGIEEGRKTFGNINKYIMNTISANYGNMFTVAFSSLFLPFIPLLPTQILLNNFVSDIPLLAIATDNVDPDFVRRPKHWNINLISKFMVYFGSLSSVFDFATILPLLYIWKLAPEPFRTAWFIESAISEILVTFAIRTRLPFFKSRPSRWLSGLSFASILLILALPFTDFGQRFFSFTGLPVHVLGWMGLVLIAYFTVTEIAKEKFFRKNEF